MVRVLLLTAHASAGVAFVDALRRYYHPTASERIVAGMDAAISGRPVSMKCIIRGGSHIAEIEFVVSPSIAALQAPLSSFEGVVLLVNKAESPSPLWPSLVQTRPFFRLLQSNSMDTEHAWEDVASALKWAATHGFELSSFFDSTVFRAFEAFPWSSSVNTAHPMQPVSYAIANKALHLSSGLKTVDLSNCGLTRFPQALGVLADTVETLNFGGNLLHTLPPWLSAFKKLRVLFFANNAFTEVPPALGQLPALYMLSFKSNRVKTVSESALAPSLGWLILTDNLISELPESLGHCLRMRKLMLANNQLSALPSSMAKLQELELLRLAANRFESLPPWLFRLPKLSWLAVGGNPCCPAPTADAPDVPVFDWTSLKLGEVLGQGASGVVYACDAGVVGLDCVAVKLFKGEATSDGLPADEMAAAVRVGKHPHTIEVLGIVSGAPSPALLLPRIPAAYSNLGGPPSFDTVTRDTYKAGTVFNVGRVLAISRGIASVCAHLHSRGICHGDVYAHNTLIDGTTGNVLLVDFGAASFYTASVFDMQALEVRAFGCLLDDILTRCTPSSKREEQQYDALAKLRARCWLKKPASRPSFHAIVTELDAIAAAERVSADAFYRRLLVMGVAAAVAGVAALAARK